jgi:hypothetical protein
MTIRAIDSGCQVAGRCARQDFPEESGRADCDTEVTEFPV